ncbi:MAG TPA: S8 family peptidase [Burkholderiaceae bacterium]
MKMPSRRLVSALCLWTLAFAFAGAAAAAERGPVRRSPSSAGTAVAETEARVIVKFKSESGAMRALAARSTQAEPQQAQALSSRLGLKLRDGRGLGARTQLMFGSGLSSAALAAKLAADSDVEYAVVDGRQRALAAPNDPLYPAGQTSQTPVVGQWYLRTPDATIVSAINGEAAWDITTGSAGIVVAVLDTGIRPEHPDLAGKIVSGYDFIHDTPTANDGDGRDSDPSDPGDAVTSADVGTVQGCTNDDIGPSSWHGTQTAGLIGAATNNGAGMASIGRNVMVQPLRVLGKCGGYDSDIIDAMRWAAGISVSGVPTNTTPAKVINMSLGSSGSCSAAYQDAVNQVAALGVVVVVAAGNDGLAVGTPANCSGVIAVAGVRHTGTKVGYSDLGPEVAISAPAGNCVTLTGTCQFPLLTTSNSGTSGPSTSIYTSGGSNASIGTSFSAPLVAGTAALMYSLDSTLTPAQVRTMLAQGARAFPASGGGAGVNACAAPSSTAQDECYCTTSTCGAGLLDAAGALKAVLLRPSISASSTSVTTGTPVTLDGSGSHAIDGASIATYSWAITSGSNIAGLSSTNAATTTLSTTAAGTVTVALTVTDSSGRQNATSASVTVAAPVPSSSGGGGGGALEPWWLAGLLAATLILSASSWTRFGSRIRQSLRRARRSSAR